MTLVPVGPVTNSPPFSRSQLPLSASLSASSPPAVAAQLSPVTIPARRTGRPVTAISSCDQNRNAVSTADFPSPWQRPAPGCARPRPDYQAERLSARRQRYKAPARRREPSGHNQRHLKNILVKVLRIDDDLDVRGSPPHPRIARRAMALEATIAASISGHCANGGQLPDPRSNDRKIIPLNIADRKYPRRCTGKMAEQFSCP